METLTKNLVTFKRWNGVKDKKFEYYGGLLKNKGGGGVDSLRGGTWQKSGVGVAFEGRGGVAVDTLIHNMPKLIYLRLLYKWYSNFGIWKRMLGYYPYNNVKPRGTNLDIYKTNK